MRRTRRGRVLRDTAAGDGLVFVDGKQYLFRLEGMWKSEFAPKVNMLVDVAFDDRGQVIALRTAPAEAVTAEQTAHALQTVKATTKTLAEDVRADALPALAQHARDIGYPTLAALAALLLGWFYFAAVSMDVGVGGRISVTFYQTLKLLNTRGIQDLVGGGSAGVYGLICFLCCGGVLLPSLWRDRRANYALLAPLVFTLLMGALIWHKFSVQMSGLEQAAAQFRPPGDPRMRQFVGQFSSNAVTQLRNSLSLGFGAWLALTASLYLAWRGSRQGILGGNGGDADSDAVAETGNARRTATGPRPVASAAPRPPAGAARDYFATGSDPPTSSSR